MSIQEGRNFLTLIEDLCGTDARRRVHRRYAGSKLGFPRTPKQDHWLAQVIGYDSAALVCMAYCGYVVTIPSAGDT